MRRYSAAALFFLAGFMATTSSGGGQPQKLQQGQIQQPSADQKQLPTNGEISYNDFSELNFSTPKKAVISFVDQFNGILPASPETDLFGICEKVVRPSCQEDCMALLEPRLSYLKSLSKKLKGAYYIPQTLSQLSESPMKIKAAWKEQLTLKDGSRILTDKSMSFVLEKTGEEWKVLRIEKHDAIK